MGRIVAGFALLVLGVMAGCNRPIGGGDASESHGRYAGAGIYPAGRMWAQMKSADTPKDTATAKLGDDEQVIVVVDSQTGEVRQCGNVSGHCVGMNPWARTLGGSAPVALAKHADQLDAEAKAKIGAAPSAP